MAFTSCKINEAYPSGCCRYWSGPTLGFLQRIPGYYNLPHLYREFFLCISMSRCSVGFFYRCLSWNQTFLSCNTYFESWNVLLKSFLYKSTQNTRTRFIDKNYSGQSLNIRTVVNKLHVNWRFCYIFGLNFLLK